MILSILSIVIFLYQKNMNIMMSLTGVKNPDGMMYMAQMPIHQIS